MMKFLISRTILTIIFFFQTFNCQAEFRPILLWHSAGECYNGYEIREWKNLIKNYLGDKVHVKSVKMSEDCNIDRVLSLTIHPFEQINKVCKELQSDPIFSNGYNVIGLSQGGVLS